MTLDEQIEWIEAHRDYLIAPRHGMKAIETILATLRNWRDAGKGLPPEPSGVMAEVPVSNKGDWGIVAVVRQSDYDALRLAAIESLKEICREIGCSGVDPKMCNHAPQDCSIIRKIVRPVKESANG